MPMEPPCAMMRPMLSARSSGALTTTCRSGFAESTSCTWCPAASSTSPRGEVTMPLFSTLGAMRYTWPPAGVVMAPWLRTLAVEPAAASKTRRPARKSSLAMLSAEATRPFTSTCAPAPNTIPFGLTRKTRPFDCSAPRICEGSWPTIRFSTALLAPCWMKRVVSPGPMLNCCQLRIAPGVLVIVRRPPWLLKVAPPCTTTAPMGSADAGLCVRQAATARTASLRAFMGGRS